jgi:hypothetical protein
MKTDLKNESEPHKLSFSFKVRFSRTESFTDEPTANHT